MLGIENSLSPPFAPPPTGLSFFIKMLGPACGYTLASYSLKFYVLPSLTPTITPSDQRWVGAWWLGWVVIGVFLAIGAFFVGMFPRALPRAAARRDYLALKLREEELGDAKGRENGGEMKTTTKDELPSSFADLMETLKRLMKNKILMNNHFAAVFYMFGFTPYWIFTPKYIEMQYKKSASSAK